MLARSKRADGGVPLLPERPDIEQYKAMDRDARDAWTRDKNWRSNHPHVVKPGDPKRDTNFKKWFGDSKIIDKTGAPLRAYHISNKNFTRFIPGGSYDEKEHESGPATWLSPYADKQPAAHHVGGYQGRFRDGTNVTPLHVSMKNPLVLDHRDAMDRAKQIMGDTYTEQFPMLIPASAVRKLREAGHDGIVYAGSNAVLRDEPAYATHALGEHPDREEEIISFDPQRQLKSAIGNNGRYDRQNSDINYDEGGAVAPRAYLDESGGFTHEGRPVEPNAPYTGPDAVGQRWREDDMLVPSGESAPRQLTPRMTYRGPQPTDYRNGRELLGGGRDGDIPFRSHWGLAQGGAVENKDVKRALMIARDQRALLRRIANIYPGPGGGMDPSPGGGGYSGPGGGKYIGPSHYADGGGVDFKQDNPAVSRGNTEWLASKQRTAYSDPALLRGAITGYFKDVVHIPVDMLDGVPGANKENPAPGTYKYDELMKDVKKEGWKPTPILVGVNHKGKAHILEGNHRVAVARALGQTHIPGDIRWWNGGEEVEGDWHPKNVVPRLQPHKRATGGSVPPFKLYSGAAKVIGAKGQAKATPQQYAAMPGIKPDELKHSKFDTLGSKALPREEVIKHLEDNALPLQETVLQAGRGMAGQDYDPDETSKFHGPKTTLPGGENYREVLLHTPPASADEHRKVLADLEQARRAKADALAALRQANEANAPNRSDMRAVYAQALMRYDELQDKAAQSNREAGANNYRSSHWDEPNVLAHVRMSDRVGPNGEKILHLEEAQSDWGQQGRERGFKDPNKYKVANEGGIWRVRDAQGQRLDLNGASGFSTEDQARAALQSNTRDVEGVPSGPYVDNTQKWTDLALKRVLHEAAHGGYDKIVVTPGDEQNKRYSLENHVKNIQYYPDIGYLHATTHDNEGVDHNDVKPEDLSKHIGKEAADRILKQGMQRYEGRGRLGGEFYHELEGEGLKVGGQGMRGYYDNILPKRLQALAQQHDPQAKVQLGSTPVADDTAPLHSLDVTPQMRDSIKANGFNSFKHGGDVGMRQRYADGGETDSPAVSRALDLTSLAQPRSPIAQAQSTLRSITTQPTEVGKTSVKSLSDAFDKGIAAHVALKPNERIANSKRAADSLGAHIGRLANGRPVPLLTKNAKLLKSETGYGDEAPVQLPDGRGVETTGLALAPAYEEGKFTTCPNSASCKAECLGKTSGNYFKVGGGKDLSAFKGPRLNSLKKTIGMLRDPENFAVRLNEEIESAKHEAAMNGNHLGIRLNVLSDLNPRIHKAIIENHPDVTFYDYTKNNTNPIAPNHHYTYSSTGVSQDGVDNPHSNWKQMRKRLDTGSNVAMAFSDREHLPEMVHDEETGKHYKVVNGDKHDFRPLDIQPQGADGVIVGLKNKKATGTTANAHVDSKGFFVKYDPGLQKTAKGTYMRGASVGLRKDGKPMLGDTVPTNRIVTIKTQRAAPPVKTNDTGGEK